MIGEIFVMDLTSHWLLMRERTNPSWGEKVRSVSSRIEIASSGTFSPVTPSRSSAAADLALRVAHRLGGPAVGGIEVPGHPEHPVGGLRVFLQGRLAPLQEVLDVRVGQSAAAAAATFLRRGAAWARTIVPSDRHS